MIYSLTIKACIWPHGALSLLPLNQRRWAEQTGCATCLTHCQFMPLFYFVCVCVWGGSLFSPTPTHWHTQKQIPSYYVFVRTTLTLKSLKRTLLCRWCDLWPQHACVLNLLTTAYISRQSWKEADVRRRKNCESKLLASKSVIQTGIEVKHKETQLYLSVNRDVKNYCLDSVYRISCYPPRMNIYYIVAPVDYIIMCVSCSQSVCCRPLVDHDFTANDS